MRVTSARFSLAILLLLAVCIVADSTLQPESSHKSSENLFPSTPVSRCAFDWECPSYRVLNDSGPFEIRRYDSSLWISLKFSLTNATMHEAYLEAVTEGSYLLSKYRGGENDRHLELNVTVPFRVRLLASEEADDTNSAQQCEPVLLSHAHVTNTLTSSGETGVADEGSAAMIEDELLSALNYSQGPPYSFVISYFLPGAYQSQPPAPLDSRLFVDVIAAHTVAVRRFTHSATNWIKVEKDMLQLEQDLESAHITRCNSGAIVAMYDRREFHSEVSFMLPDRPPVINRHGSAPVLPTFPPSSASSDDSRATPEDAVTPQIGDALAICYVYECPAFDLVSLPDEQSGNVEIIRNYSRSRWVSITQSIQPSTFHQAWSEALSLFNSFRKHGNDQGVELPATAPLLISIREGDESFEVTFARPVSASFDIDPPVPLDSRLQIIEFAPRSLQIYGPFSAQPNSHAAPSWHLLWSRLRTTNCCSSSHDSSVSSCACSVAVYGPLEFKLHFGSTRGPYSFELWQLKL